MLLSTLTPSSGEAKIQIPGSNKGVRAHEPCLYDKYARSGQMCRRISALARRARCRNEVVESGNPAWSVGPSWPCPHANPEVVQLDKAKDLCQE